MPNGTPTANLNMQVQKISDLQNESTFDSQLSFFPINMQHDMHSTETQVQYGHTRAVSS